MKFSSWVTCLMFLVAGAFVAIVTKASDLDFPGKGWLQGTPTSVQKPLDDQATAQRPEMDSTNLDGSSIAAQPCDCEACAGGQPEKCRKESSPKRKRFQERFWLGVQVDQATQGTLKQLNLVCGQHVSYVIPRSPAAKCFQQHDVIYEFNGEKVRCSTTLGKLIQKNKNKVAKVKIYRGGKPVELTVKPRKISIKQITEKQQSDYVTPDDHSVATTFDFSEVEPGDQKQYLVYLVRRPVVLSKKGSKKTSKKEKEKLNLVSVVSFKRDRRGRRSIVIHNGNRKEEYLETEFNKLPTDVSKLVRFISREE